MTVIRPNSISGITSITAQGDTVNFFKSDGNSAGLQLNGVNFNTTTGVSTFLSLVVTGNVSIAGTLTYEDVTNVDSIGIITARTGIQVLAGGINATGIITATSFSGDGSALTGIAVTSNISTNAIVNSGITTVAAGTSALPSISPTGDSNTGIFFPSADTIAFGEGGSEAARIDSSSRLLLGTSTARNNFNDSGIETKIQIEGAGNDDSAALSIIANSGTTSSDKRTGLLVLGRTRGTAIGSNTAVVQDDAVGMIEFKGNDGTSFTTAATIKAQVDGSIGTDDMPGRLVFSTTADGAASPTERLRITSAGLVGIGTNNPGSYSSSANNLVVQDTAGEGGITIVSSTTAGSNIFFADTDGTAQGQIKYQHNGDYMRFYTNATERLRIDSSGRLGIGTGSPSQLLDVVGNSASVKVTETGGADVRITAGGFTGFFGTYSNHPLQILTNSTNAVHITSAGLVGIGTNSPSSDGPLTLSNSATTPTIFFERESTNYNGAIQCSAYGTITFYNGADSSVVSGLTPRMTIDGQYGNVGIGTVTPRRTLEVSGADGLFCLNATDTSTGTSQLLFGDTDDDNIGRIYYDHANNAMAFYTNTSERMRIGSDGILYLGATSTVSTIANARLQVIGSNAATFLGDSGLAYQQVVYIHHNNTSGNNLFMEFGTEGVVSTRGSVDYNRAAGQVRYNVTSDRRLKSDIQSAGTALNALSAIQVRSYKWAETGYQVDHGFIAQELNEIAPDAVKVGDDGEEVTDTWAVDNGKLVPLLTKALQEAIAKIETLEARLSALESA
jgi:hypothetical protein